MGSCNSDLGTLVCVVNTLQMSRLTIEKIPHNLQLNRKFFLNKMMMGSKTTEVDILICWNFFCSIDLWFHYLIPVVLLYIGLIVFSSMFAWRNKGCFQWKKKQTGKVHCLDICSLLVQQDLGSIQCMFCFNNKLNELFPTSN